MPENTIWGVIVRIWQGVIRVGNRTATPTPASGALVAGTVTIESAGNSTNGKLEMEATTSGGTVRKLTIQPSQAMTGSHTLTGLTALPGSTEMLTVTSAGQLGTSTLPTGTVGGTGTDNHLARWDGTSDIQDTGWVIDDDDLMSISGAETGYINVTTTNSLSASSGAIEGYGTGFAAGIYGENSGTGAGLYGKNSDAGVGIWGTNSDSVLAAIHGANTNGGPDFEAGNSGIYQAPEITTPADAPTGRRRLYAKSDGWYDLDDAGVETGPFGAGGGGGSGIGAAQAMAYASMGMN